MERSKEIEQSQESNVRSEVRMISCQIIQDKLVSQLNDGREVSISIYSLTRGGILDKKVKLEQLKKNELQNEGRYIYFPDIDDILSTRIISEGLFKSCGEEKNK